MPLGPLIPWFPVDPLDPEETEDPVLEPELPPDPIEIPLIFSIFLFEIGYSIAANLDLGYSTIVYGS